MNLSLRRQEHEDGTIGIIDMQGKDTISVELHPAQKQAFVNRSIGLGPKKDPDIIDKVKQFEQESTERLGTKEHNGKTLYGFRYQPNKHMDYTVWVDAKTKLPVEIEQKRLTRGEILFMDEFEFDFELDPSVFSTDIPDGYDVSTTITDCRPFESKAITTEDIREDVIRTGTDHPFYTLKQLPWMERLILVQVVNPLSLQGKMYVTGIRSRDGNRIV
ncbi:hypothetical protein ACFL6U_16850 [Planctomycetota bacterium]